MNTLILSCSTGQGHDSCARAIRDFYAQTGDGCQIDDALAMISKDLSSALTWGHSAMYRYVPGLFRWGYSYSESHSALFAPGGAAFRLLSKGSEALERRLLTGGFDSVICTHPFAALMLTQVMKKRPGIAASAYLATDYVCHPGLGETALDLYFIPHDSLCPGFVQAGLDPQRLVSTGIPVREMFYRQPIKRPEDHGGKRLLLMCGSMGCGPMDELAQSLISNMAPDMRLDIVCGTNHSLYRYLSWSWSRDERVQVLGYVKDMAGLMAQADLCLTKPGGISVTECAALGLPMVLIDAVSGCEGHNLRFFTQTGGGVSAPTVEGLGELSLELLKDPRTLAEMSSRLMELHLGDGAGTLHREMKGMVREKYETA